MITPTWDTLFLFALLSFSVFGFVVRQGKIIPLMIGLYIALAVTSEVGLEIFRFLRRSEIGGFDMSLFIVRLLVFVLLTFLLFIEGESIVPAADNGSPASASIKGGVFGALAGAIFITTVIHFMAGADQTNLIAKSKLAASLYPWRVWLLVPFPFMLAVSSLIRRFK